MVAEKLLLKVSVMFCWLVGFYCSCTAAPLLRGISQFDVNKTFSMTIRSTRYQCLKYPADLSVPGQPEKSTEDGKWEVVWKGLQENYAV